MQGFVQGADRQQTTLLPECLDDWVDEGNSIRAVDVFVDALELRDLGFDGVDPAATGRPADHPSRMLKLYIYGYLNRVQSSRRLEREAGRNLEVMWLTGRLVPDHKTIADFRKDNGPAIKKVCARFIALCRKMGLLAKASVAIDGSKFKAVNSRDNNFTEGKIQRRQKQIEESGIETPRLIQLSCTLASLNSSRRRHNTTNSRQTSRISASARSTVGYGIAPIRTPADAPSPWPARIRRPASLRERRSRSPKCSTRSAIPARSARPRNEHSTREG
jgi:transposase